jgi:hypothetical protein
MKRVLAIAAVSLSMLTLCSLLLINAGIAKASEPGYNIIEVYGGPEVTADGHWVTGEWDEGWLEYVSNGSVTDDRFVYKMDSSDGVTYYMSWLYDFSDNTTDAGDIWQLYINGWPDADTTPDENCTKIEITGHTTMTAYQGDGAGWVETDALDGGIVWADNITVHDVPFNYPHYCLEIKVDKAQLGAWGANPPTNGNGFMVTMYDASNPSQGVIAWPPTDPDDPSSWGLIYTYDTAIPEGFGVVLVLLLSSVAVAVGFYVLRKRPKTLTVHVKTSTH